MYFIGDFRMPCFETIDYGYLYHIVNDHLVESYGEIRHRDEFVYNANNYEPELNIFVVLTDTGLPICKEYCSGEEGVVVDGKVWLSKPDRLMAANFLMLYEVRKIQELREQMERAIEVHNTYIDILNKENEE